MSVAKVFVNEFLLRYGLNGQILTDQRAQFESLLFKEICELLDIDKKRSTSFHPQTNGIQERFNRTIEDMLSKFVSTVYKSKRLGRIVCITPIAYRSSVHESTKQTPYMMFFGHHALLHVHLLGFPSYSERKMPGHDIQYVLELQERLQKTTVSREVQ